MTCKIWPNFIFDLQALTNFIFYLTCKLWLAFIPDLQAVTYLCIWLICCDLPLYLTCQLCPTFIFDLQAEVCTAPCVGHRDPIKPHCSLCADVGHDDKARGPEHYGLVRPTDTLQSDANWLRLGAASGVCWRPPGRWRSLPLALGTLWRQSGQTLGQRGKSLHRHLLAVSSWIDRINQQQRATPTCITCYAHDPVQPKQTLSIWNYIYYWQKMY